MPNLTIGATLRELKPLEGTWSVWSMAAEAPGAFFIVPVSDEARATGLKYAVVRATQKRNEAEPDLELVRTDPPRPDLTDPKPANPYAKKEHR